MALGDTVGQISRIVRDRPDLFPPGINFDQILQVKEAGLYIQLGNDLRDAKLNGPQFEQIREAVVAPTTSRPSGPGQTAPTPSPEPQQGMNLPANLESLYQRIIGSGLQDIEESFGERRKNVIREERGLNRLRSPASIPNISKVDDQRAKAEASFLGQVAGQRAGQEFDLAKTIQNLIEGRRQFDIGAGLQTKQFGERLALDKEANRVSESLGQLGLQESGIASSRLSDAKRPGILDYINTAFTGLGALGSPG